MKKLTIFLLSFYASYNVYATVPQEPVKATAPVTPSAPALETVKTFYPSFADIVEPLTPAVVNIYSTKRNKSASKVPNTLPQDSFPFDHFNEFFEQFNRSLNADELYTNPKATALGSGFIIDSTGLIVTNHHVINNADEIHVKLSDNTELPAKLIGTDQKTDLALLKVETKTPLPFVIFGNSSKARIGDSIIAIGNPFGLGGSVTSGIVSSKGRDIDLESGGIVDDYIQTDAAINSGNSGGPMFNMNGEVIGVNTAIFSPTGTNVGIGFAIPSNTAHSVIEQLKKNGKISRGRLDINIQEITQEMSEGLGLKETMGALVRNVIAGGAGDKAGIKVGDVIIELAGQPVKNLRKLQVLVAESPVNNDVKIVVIRAGKNVELTAKILENARDEEVIQTSEDVSSSQPEATGTLKKNNIIFNNLTEELRKKYNINQQASGVIITNIVKDPNNFILKPGDLVVEISQQPVNSLEQFSKAYENLKKAGKKNIVLFVKREGGNIFLTLPIE